MQGLRILALFPLLVLFAGGQWHLEGIHRLIHEHVKSISHTEAQEKDSCHRSVYHSDKQNGCNHQSHIITVNKCDLCDLICHPNLAMPSSTLGLSAEPSSTELYITFVEIIRGAHFYFSTRAPPFA